MKVPARLALPAGGMLVALLLSAAVAPSHAGHGSTGAGGPYRGFAHGAAVAVHGVTTETARLVGVEAGVANAAVDSEGLKKTLSVHRRPIVPGGAAKSHARGHATIVEAGVAQAPDADGQLRPWRVESLSPGGDGAADDFLLRMPVGTVAFAEAARRTASSRWNGSSCVVGSPIAVGGQHAARLQLAETRDAPNTEPDEGFDAPMIGIDAGEGGTARAATSVVTKEQLYAGAGDGLGLLSVTRATLAPVTLFKGGAAEFTIEIDGPALLAARADGTPGGADVVYKAPLVSVIQNGTERQVLPSQPTTVRLPGSGAAIAEISVGVMKPLPAPAGLGSSVKAANGTRAAAQAAVVEITLLDAADPEFRGATVALGHMEAAALVPAGGITCPLDVEKVADPPAVASGEQFTATITVTNVYECPLVGVAVVDEITTEGQSLFEVVGTAPAAQAVPGGSELSSGTVEWTQLPDIPPGESIKVEVTVEAQGGAGRILDVATATATIANCPAGLDDDGVDVGGVVNVVVPAVGEARAEVEESVVLGVQIPLPATGAGAAGALGLGMVGSAAVLAAHLRSRRRR